MSNIYLSIVIPAFNEEKLIKETLLEASDFLSRQNYSYEIIVVDDGSVDKTSAILDGLKAAVKNLTIIRNKKNFGKGYSVRRGMLAAKGRFRLFMDADNSTGIDQVKNFFPFLEEGYQIVIGDRSLRESVILKNQPVYKQILGNIGNIFVKVLTVSGINDTQCGFKCFSDRFVEKVFPGLVINRWGFDMEILAIADKFGYIIKTVPIVWRNGWKSNVHLKDYFFTLLELFKIKINLVRKIYESK